MEKNLESFTQYCKDFITDHIDNWVGEMVYGSELGYNITEGINADGSCTYSTYMAKQYLQAWWDDAADYWEYEKLSFGEHAHNPFDSAEAYMVCMVIEGVNRLLGDFFTGDAEDLWDRKFELTQAIADEICECVNNAYDIRL